MPHENFKLHLAESIEDKALLVNLNNVGPEALYGHEDVRATPIALKARPYLLAASRFATRILTVYPVVLPIDPAHKQYY